MKRGADIHGSWRETQRYQLDYILVRQRLYNSVNNAYSYPGTDADSDHNLVVMKQTVKLKKLKREKEEVAMEPSKIRGEI